MKKDSVLALAFSLLLPALILISCSPQPMKPMPSMNPPMERESRQWQAQQIFLLLKKENPRLAWNQCLAQAASMRAEELVSKSSFSHRDPATGENPVYDMIRKCFEFRVAGENLARGSDDPRELHQVLMQSPSHRGNIMDPRYELVGVGCCESCCVELFVGF